MKIRNLAIGSVLLVAVPAIAFAALPSGSGPWKRTGVVFADKTVNNIDIERAPDGRWRAYYMQMGSLKSAISTTGKKFTAEGTLAGVSGSHPEVVRLADGSYRIYVAAHNGTITSAVSSDGRRFTAEPGIRLRPGTGSAADKGGLIHPTIVSTGKGYRMYYDAVGSGRFLDWRGIYSAVSSDGLTWVKEKGARIDTNTYPVDTAGLIWSPYVERRRGVYLMYFSAEFQSVSKGGVYVASSVDGKKFTVRGRVLGVDPRTGSRPPGPGGQPGLPQDAVVLRTGVLAQMYVWQPEAGYLRTVLG